MIPCNMWFWFVWLMLRASYLEPACPAVRQPVDPPAPWGMYHTLQVRSSRYEPPTGASCR
jgi:hypothetical protein